MLKNKKIYTIPIAAFLAMIFTTSFILKLPICNQVPISYMDALFEAASNVTATGSNVVDLSSQFTFFRTASNPSCNAGWRDWIYVIFFCDVYGK